MNPKRKGCSQRYIQKLTLVFHMSVGKPADRVFTACELETQGLFTVLCTEVYPDLSQARPQLLHEAVS